MRFLEHAVCFAYTGTHADIYFKLSPSRFFYQVEEMLYRMVSGFRQLIVHFKSSNARFNLSTLIRSGPKNPANGFCVLEIISCCKFPSAIPRIFAIRFTCTLAACTEMLGSRPLPLAVTISEGMSDFFTPGL